MLKFFGKVNCCILLLLFLMVKLGWAQHQSIISYLSSLPDSVSVSIKAETKEGRVIFENNPTKQVPSASIIKVPILISLIQQVEQGKLNWNETYQLQGKDKVGGAGNLQHLNNGTRYSFRELAREMIKISDNTATNILIREVGIANINQFLTKNDLSQTLLQREMMDFEAIKTGKQNYTSASDMNKIYSLLINQQLLSKKWTKKAIKILTKCEDDYAIPKMLPKNIKIAHKTGTLNYVRGDSGIIFNKKEIIILSVFVEGFSTFEQADEIIATISKLVVEADFIIEKTLKD